MTVLLRALGFNSQEILGMFYENNSFKIKKGKEPSIALERCLRVCAARC